MITDHQKYVISKVHEEADKLHQQLTRQPSQPNEQGLYLAEVELSVPVAVNEIKITKPMQLNG